MNPFFLRYKWGPYLLLCNTTPHLRSLPPGTFLVIRNNNAASLQALGQLSWLLHLLVLHTPATPQHVSIAGAGISCLYSHLLQQATFYKLSQNSCLFYVWLLVPKPISYNWGNTAFFRNEFLICVRGRLNARLLGHVECDCMWLSFVCVLESERDYGAQLYKTSLELFLNRVKEYTYQKIMCKMCKR